MSPYLLKINPYLETVEEIPFSDSYQFLTSHIGSRLIAFTADTTSGDTALVDPQALAGELPPAWQLTGNPQVYLGTAIWVNVSENGQLRTPLLTQKELVERLLFLGFTDDLIVSTEYEEFGDFPKEDDDDLDEEIG